MAKKLDVVSVGRMQRAMQLADGYLRSVAAGNRTASFDAVAQEIVKELSGGKVPPLTKFTTSGEPLVAAMPKGYPMDGDREALHRYDESDEVVAAIESNAREEMLGDVESAIDVPDPTPRKREAVEKQKARIAKQIDALFKSHGLKEDWWKTAADKWHPDLLAELIFQPTNDLRRQVIGYYGGAGTDARWLSDTDLALLCARAIKRAIVKKAMARLAKQDAANARRTREEPTRRVYANVPHKDQVLAVNC